MLLDTTILVTHDGKGGLHLGNPGQVQSTRQSQLGIWMGRKVVSAPSLTIRLAELVVKALANAASSSSYSSSSVKEPPLPIAAATKLCTLAIAVCLSLTLSSGASLSHLFDITIFTLH